MILELHKAFSHIKYYDEKHQYFDTRNGKQLISVTTWLKQFQQEFQSDYWSKKKAKEKGISQEEMLTEWDDKRVYGATRGTYVHQAALDMSNNRYFKYRIPEEIVRLKKEEEFLVETNLLIAQLEEFFKAANIAVVKNELIVGNDEIAGQVDLLAMREDKYYIIDYKTDLQIEFSTRFGNLKKPFQDMPSTNFSKYTAQLNLYRELLESAVDIKIEKMIIVHLSPSNDTYKLYEIPKRKIITNEA